MYCPISYLCLMKNTPSSQNNQQFEKIFEDINQTFFSPRLQDIIEVTYKYRITINPNGATYFNTTLFEKLIDKPLETEAMKA